MTSAAQANSNRQNASHSTGPRTETGKQQSARNSLKHGLASGTLIIEGESLAEFQACFQDIFDEYQPATVTEDILVCHMAEQFWFGRRATLLMAHYLNLNNDGDNGENDQTRQLALMLRYQTAADRAFYKALSELRKLQKERRQNGIGFVPQNPLPPQSQPEPEPAPAPAGFVSQTPEPYRRPSPKVGRNQPCPCGSGRKFKKCCLLHQPLAA
jgi:hypothetical protein